MFEHLVLETINVLVHKFKSVVFDFSAFAKASSHSQIIEILLFCNQFQCFTLITTLHSNNFRLYSNKSSKNLVEKMFTRRN